MQYEICRTLEHQLRSYEMEIQIRLNESGHADSLDVAREGYRKALPASPRERSQWNLVCHTFGRCR
jgi:hypothetical protein